MQKATLAENDARDAQHKGPPQGLLGLLSCPVDHVIESDVPIDGIEDGSVVAKEIPQLVPAIQLFERYDQLVVAGQAHD